MDVAVPLLLAVGRRPRWLLLAAAAGGLLGFLAGRSLWSAGYVAVAQLIRYETPDPGLFQPREISPPTLAGMIDSAEVHTRVGARSTPPRTAGEIAGAVRISPERNSDILNVAITLPDRAAAAAVANAYAEEAVRFTQQLQAQEAAEASRYLEQQVKRVEEETAALEAKMRTLPPAALQAAAAPRPAALLTRLDDARGELAELLGRYTEAHPRVQEQRAKIKALEDQVIGLGRPDGARSGEGTLSPGGTGENQEVFREVLKAMEGQRLTLVGRLRLTRMLQQTPPGYYRIFASATPERAVIEWPMAKIGGLSLLAGLAGLALVAGVCVVGELLDRRLKTVADVRRVTQLPVLATLGRLDTMPSAQQAQWAFRTWTALQNRLSESPNRGLVCGFTSSGPGEGRTLWVRKLAEAANQCGFRVLTITTRPSPPGDGARRVDTADFPVPAVSEGTVPGAILTTNVLAAPAEIARQLASADSPPLVHIPLPGWVWNLERRKEWLTALRHWSEIENLVILVELPPASVPESVLLAQNLPNLVWLVDGTRAGAPETCMQLQTLRHARCNVVGAVVNRADSPMATDRMVRWLPQLAAVLLLVLLLPAPGRAQTPPAGDEPAAPARAALSVISPAQRADWQKRLTLGPGDVLRLALYGEPELTRAEVTVQPDGRLSYLEAQDVVAAGLTVDEFRAKLDGELGRYRRAPRSMIVPVEIHSKKYFMLGKVRETGVFTLERPLTVVEAVARARGFETGLSGRNVVELADLSRSFLVRGGRRAAVDFERLFAAGDLAQNIAVEPDDYFYFPAADVREVHLLGAVQAPGPVNFTAGLTATRAIASGGGFTRRAWPQRVLIVRGSLRQPQTLVVTAADVLRGRAADVPLQPRDIVFVSERPWIRAEDLLDDAISAFAQSVVVFWTTDKVIPVVR